MLTRTFTLIGLVAALSIFLGCGPNAPFQTETLLDKNWGKSFESAKNNQILNPEAGKNLDPVTGFDGQAADTNMEKYKEGFKGKPPTTEYNINLGEIGSIGR